MESFSKLLSRWWLSEASFKAFLFHKLAQPLACRRRDADRKDAWQAAFGASLGQRVCLEELRGSTLSEFPNCVAARNRAL